MIESNSTMGNKNIYQREEMVSTLYEDSCHIIEEARVYACRAVNSALTLRNWKLGERISHEHLEDDGRAEYGKYVIKSLSDKLTDKYGKGFNRRLKRKCGVQELCIEIYVLTTRLLQKNTCNRRKSCAKS